MDATTWRSLILKDQESWDLVSDDGKQKILDYASKRGTNNKSGNSNGKSLMVNNHEIIFE